MAVELQHSFMDKDDENDKPVGLTARLAAPASWWVEHRLQEVAGISWDGVCIFKDVNMCS